MQNQTEASAEIKKIFPRHLAKLLSSEPMEKTFVEDSAACSVDMHQNSNYYCSSSPVNGSKLDSFSAVLTTQKPSNFVHSDQKCFYGFAMNKTVTSSAEGKKNKRQILAIRSCQTIREKLLPQKTVDG